MNPTSAMLIEELVDEATFLWRQRAAAVNAPHYSRVQFAALDERLAAQLDALCTIGSTARDACIQALEVSEPAADSAFVAGVLQGHLEPDRFAPVVEQCRGVPDAMRGLASALGWLGWSASRGIVSALAQTQRDDEIVLALHASLMHRHCPGKALEQSLRADDPAMRGLAARMAGELGRLDLVAPLRHALSDAAAGVRFRASCALCLLGDRREAVEALQEFAVRPGPRGRAAQRLLLQALDIDKAHRLLQELDRQPDATRLRIIGAGEVGDARYVPWLIERMTEAAHARIAAEAFVHITGADFNLDQLEALPPDGHDDGPSDDPDDDTVELPQDIPLPWPDHRRVEAWWATRRGGFEPGRRVFLGQPVTPGHCMALLRGGLQRQRVLAAQHLSLSAPGAPLFPTRAPAWRQQALLDAA